MTYLSGKKKLKSTWVGEWKATNSFPVSMSCVCDFEHINMYIPLLFNDVAWAVVWKDSSLENPPKVPDQRGLLKNSITIELPFIPFHLTLLNSPYGWVSAGGRTPDTGQPTTAKFLHLWSIELSVTWVCACVWMPVSVHTYTVLYWCLLSYCSQEEGPLKECVSWTRPWWGR